MNIVFVTTQSHLQSTLIGRVFPLAEEFQNMGHEVTVLGHKESDTASPLPNFVVTGPNPFSRTKTGKKRRSGIALIAIMKINALRAAWKLMSIRPDVIIIVKPLPENTLAVALAKIFLWNAKVILDSDDFELFANKVSSFFERAAIHASERIASSLASHITVATPFLLDHMKQLTGGRKAVTLIPTGLNLSKKYISQAAANTILYIGSVSVSSGHRVDLLPEIFSIVKKEIPNATLAIAGSGDDEHTLREAFNAKGLSKHVHWLGRFDVKNAEHIALGAAVLIDPIDASIENRAKSSFRTALALACGMPIVTSNIGIRTMLIPDNFHERFFAAPEDAASYAQKIIAVLKHTLSEAERTALQERAGSFTWKKLAEEYYQCII